MRTRAWETVSQIALRNCSSEIRGEVSVYGILMKGDARSQAHMLAEECYWSLGADISVNGFSAFLDRRRGKKLGS